MVWVRHKSLHTFSARSLLLSLLLFVFLFLIFLCLYLFSRLPCILSIFILFFPISFSVPIIFVELERKHSVSGGLVDGDLEAAQGWGAGSYKDWAK